MADTLKSNQAVWKNTIKVFWSQLTQMEKMVATAKQCVKDFEDPDKGIGIRDVKRIVDPIVRKLELLNNYVTSMTALLPATAGEDTDTMNMDNLSKELTSCMELVEHSQNECAAFYHYIEDVEMTIKKEMKLGRTGTPATSREDRTFEVKGIASALKPEKLTTSVAAQDISLWLERWEEYKLNSLFCKVSEKSILAYLKTCVSRDILAAINYKEVEMEKKMLDRIKDYLNTKVHPTVI